VGAPSAACGGEGAGAAALPCAGSTHGAGRRPSIVAATPSEAAWLTSTFRNPPPRLASNPGLNEFGMSLEESWVSTATHTGR
jgi:hypothetical protein